MLVIYVLTAVKIRVKPNTYFYYLLSPEHLHYISVTPECQTEDNMHLIIMPQKIQTNLVY